MNKASKLVLKALTYKLEFVDIILHNNGYCYVYVTIFMFCYVLKRHNVCYVYYISKIHDFLMMLKNV